MQVTRHHQERPPQGAEADVARVLIIDDAAARNGLRRLFEAEGHHVEELADALGDA